MIKPKKHVKLLLFDRIRKENRKNILFRPIRRFKEQQALLIKT